MKNITKTIIIASVFLSSSYISASALQESPSEYSSSFGTLSVSHDLKDLCYTAPLEGVTIFDFSSMHFNEFDFSGRETRTLNNQEALILLKQMEKAFFTTTSPSILSPIIQAIDHKVLEEAAQIAWSR